MRFSIRTKVTEMDIGSKAIFRAVFEVYQGVKGWGLGLKHGNSGQEGIDSVSQCIPNHEFANHNGFLVPPSAWLCNDCPPNLPLPLLNSFNQYVIFFLGHSWHSL